MKKRSKLSEVDIFGKSDTKQKSLKTELPYVVKSFRLPVDMANKLKEYTKAIAPKHIKVTESEVLRYMIEHFDVEEAKKNFFNTK